MPAPTEYNTWGKKGFQKGFPFCRSGRFGNPFESVSDVSFPHFCTHRNVVPRGMSAKLTAMPAPTLIIDKPL